jgi:hypothetical protein
MKNFLTFRTMLAPILIQIIFWIIVAFLIIVGILDIVHHAPLKILFQVIIIGPLVTRVICETLILFFRMNNNLIEIKQLLKQPKGNP